MRTMLVIGCAVACLACLCGGAATSCSDSPDPGSSSPTTLTSTTSSPTAAEATAGASSTTTRPPSTTTSRPSPAEDLLATMTLRQKAAQVLLLAIDGTTVSASTQKLLAEGPPGGILLLGHNIVDAAQTRALTEGLRSATVASGSRIGVFIAVDQEGGLVQRVHDGVPDVPRARRLGEESSPEGAALLATETAQGLLALGVNMNLAPVADVVADPASFLYTRTYGGDPELVSAFVSAVVKAYAETGLISVVKHFPGHGSAAGNTHGERVVSSATRAEFDAIHLPPFRAAFASGAEGAMAAHVIATAYDEEHPASLSSAVIQDLLREDLGFTGLVISDDLEMAAALLSTDAGAKADAEAAQAAALAEAAVAAVGAGCDLLICTGTLNRNLQVLDAVVAAVTNGDLSAARLDEAVLSVLELKLRHDIVASLDPPPS
jgi:beta-N-acetylhexosaminidase